ncbi:hypothetical protein VTK73DRAFT_4244 [Phialemonium thermophilum]|uniref:Uncharacterized protein n=1 Tax=Phialemonium thermophilum TaxID=223376 RepID=A0ABR3WV54_9PEZI
MLRYNVLYRFARVFDWSGTDLLSPVSIHPSALLTKDSHARHLPYPCHWLKGPSPGRYPVLRILLSLFFIVSLFSCPHTTHVLLHAQTPTPLWPQARSRRFKSAGKKKEDEKHKDKDIEVLPLCHTATPLFPHRRLQGSPPPCPFLDIVRHGDPARRSVA